MAFYEIVFIIRPDASTNQVDQIATKFAGICKDKGGNILKTEQWGLRTLAYRVKKHRKGYYVMLGVDGSGEMVTEVERQMRLSDDILRFLSVRVDEMTDAPSVQMRPSRGRRGDEEEDTGSRPSRGRRRESSDTQADTAS